MTDPFNLVTETPTARIVTASAPLVDALLLLNTHNRKHKPGWIKYLVNEMGRGRFVLTNQGIGVTKSGFLSDGQNRLYSIRDAGYPAIRFVLVTGLDDEAQVAVDRHARRSQTDVIKLLMNRNITTQIVAAANVILNIRQNRDGNALYIRNSSDRCDEFDIAEFVASRDALLAQLMPAMGQQRAAVTAMLIEYADRYSVEAACELASQIKDGLELTATSPAWRMRKWLAAHKSGNVDATVECYRVGISVCVAHARGHAMQVLRPSLSWDELPRRRNAAFVPASPHAEPARDWSLTTQ